MKNEIIAIDNRYIEGTYKRNQVVISHGKGATCYDVEGKKYIDFTSGIGVNSLGFCNEKWVEGVTEQVKKLQHTSNLYYTQPCAVLAEKLIKRTGFEKVFFANSGAEANECAIKAARKYGNTKGKNEIITLKDSFHGRTIATVTATGQENYHKDFHPFLQGFFYGEGNNIESIEKLVTNKTCAIILEVIQGEGGINVLEKGFLTSVEILCKEKDILFIIDEVQTGIGRTGKFFAYEHFNINPDMVTFAKGLGGGLPIGGVLFGKKISGILKAGDHGTTFGGNPVACAGANVVFDQITEEFLKEVDKKGQKIKEEIESFKLVTKVVGKGLMLGIKVKGKEPVDIVLEAEKKGLLLLTAKDKVRLLPPLNISYEEVEEGMSILREILN